MTVTPLRAALAFVVALAVLSAGVYAVQQALYTRPPVLDLTPVQAGPPAASAPQVQSVAETTTAPGVPVLDPAWVRATARRAGIPEVALAAYARAELESPASCGLGWTTLAGIGWVESQHGTLGQRTIGLDGHSSSPILGPALDGEGGFKAIPSTPTTQSYHGDQRWDHAVGPMQFIPSTWESWGTDGDGDGLADPNDLDDAAAAAGAYLCADGRDLTSAEGWTAAVLSYNRSGEYLDLVHSAASAYAQRTA